MPGVDRLTAAIRLAATVHEGQTDKGGAPYMLHVLHVMSTVDTSGTDFGPLHDDHRVHLLAAAVLHDAVEDCKPGQRVDLERHIYEECGDRVAQAVDAITKRADEPYEAYLVRVAADWMARRIKLADLRHNMDPTRMPDRPITDRDLERWEKYRRAYIYLLGKEAAFSR
jgi:(p)ppGpp synthase/HD superfamily hydrolase